MKSLVCLFLFAVPALAQEKVSVKVGDADPPMELSESIRKLLASKSVQLLDPAGQAIGEFWFRAQTPTDANETQVKNGLTYKEIKQTEILGAVRFGAEHRDYRKQKIPAGVYTLRLGYQPTDGDHQGSSQYQDFLVALAAAKDTKAEAMEPKAMIETSMKSIASGHPCVFMLFPNSGPKAEPEILAKAKKHFVLSTRTEILAGGKKTGTYLGIGVTVVGAAE